jgi:hypothetical protein
MWFGNADVFGQSRLCSQFATLTAKLGSFVPGGIPPYFWPQTPQSKALWKKFGKNLLKEQMTIYEDRLTQDPTKAAKQKHFLNKPDTNDPELIAWEKEYQQDLAECRELALQRCKARRQAGIAGRRGKV